MSTWRVADDYSEAAPPVSPPAPKSQGVPADYGNEADPLDVAGMQNLVDDLHTEWWQEPPDVQRQAIANAFRAALTSPRQNLQWNSIVYQDMMGIPPEESDPDVFENTIRQKKAQWDSFGQQAIDSISENSTNPDLIAHVQNGGVSKYMPGIWGNVRNVAKIGPYIEQLRQAALEDIARGGDGRYFREQLLGMNIPGIGPKIAAFVWLLLAPRTSKLATIDVHMMRHFGEQGDSPKDYTHYLNLENQLDEQRKAEGYHDIPLGVYQWATWDRQRTPGWHQDHTPLRPLNPTNWKNVDWAPQPARRRKAVQEQVPGQEQLFSKWKRR